MTWNMIPNCMLKTVIRYDAGQDIDGGNDSVKNDPEGSS
jgi:hypothetical protein